MSNRSRMIVLILLMQLYKIRESKIKLLQTNMTPCNDTENFGLCDITHRPKFSVLKLEIVGGGGFPSPACCRLSFVRFNGKLQLQARDISRPEQQQNCQLIPDTLSQT